MRSYLVTGSGPVGSTLALMLAGAGHAVVLATRSGGGPEHPNISRRAADALDAAAVAAAMADATAVFHCVHAAFSAAEWERTLPATEAIVLAEAGRRDIPVVFPESLFSYTRPGSTMVEAGPRDASGGKRGVRTRLLAARAASPTPTVSVVASDFYGPRVLTAHAGERMLRAVFSGKRLVVIGDPDMPHSFTYVSDLAEAMIRAAHRPDLWNSVLHAPTAPPTTQRAMAGAFAEAAGVPAPRVNGTPGWLLRSLGRVSPGVREIGELAYQFERPFVMDSSHSQKLLGFGPTPLPVGARATVDWWRGRAAATQ